MDFLLVAKAIALVTLAVANKMAFIPPNQPDTKRGSRKFGSADPISRVAHWFFHAAVAFIEILLASELAVIGAHEFPSVPFSATVLTTLVKDPSVVPRFTMSPSFAVATVLLVAGAAIRKHCYDTLGRLFTFQLTMQKEHKLVTYGPYSVVRHPAYTGFALAIAGMLMSQMLPGTYPVESGFMNPLPVKVFMWVWTAWYTIMILITLRRTSVEDEVLRKEFGKQWEEWAERTPYKLLPFVF